MARTIRVLQSVGGLDFSWAPGELVDLDDAEATKWADGVRAEYADGQPPAPQDQTPASSPDQGTDGEAGTTDDGQDDDGPPDGGPFAPTAHPIKEVLAYLGGAGEQEAMRVLQLEADGEDRRGIAKEREAILARARAVDQEHAEHAAEASRGGGRTEPVETR